MKKKHSSLTEKERYELLIVQEQYKQLTTPWYRKLEPWKSISWSLLTLLTILVMYKNGLFDFRMKEIELTVKAMEAKRDNLEFDIKKNATWKDSLYVEQNRLIIENKVLENQQIQMALANKKMYENLDDRGKRMYDLSQQLVSLQKEHQRLVDEKEFSSSIFTWKNLSPSSNTNSFATLLPEKNVIQVPSILNTDYSSYFTNSSKNPFIISTNTNTTTTLNDILKFHLPIDQTSATIKFNRLNERDTILPYTILNPILKNY